MWTEMQQRAIDAPIADNLVSAAAGSGKTAVMVERIVSRVVSGKADIDRLLIVTFTNAAAAELKGRLMQKIMSELDTAENTEHLNRQLMLINNASICTIHSFCLDVLRANFHRLSLSPGFRIADEAETELARRNILDAVFDEYYENNDSEFLDLVDRYTSKRDSQLMDIIFKMYDYSMSTPDGAELICKMSDEFLTDNKWLDITLERVHDGCAAAMEHYRRAVSLCKFSDDFVKPLALVSDEADRCEHVVNACGWDSVYAALADLKFDVLRFPKAADKDICEKVKYHRNTAKDICKNLAAKYVPCTLDELNDDMKAAHKEVKKLAEIMCAFSDKFSEYKREKNIVDFNDLEHLALSLLVDSNGRRTNTAIALAERFDEIYVDEYQDCNSVQEAIFNAVSRKQDGKPNMFMVGDMKQSIYRFRGSEPTLFKNKFDAYPDYGTGDGKFNRIIMSKNFRSRSAVLDAVNSVFAQLMCDELGELEYDENEFLYYNDGSYEDVNTDMNTADIVCIDDDSPSLSESSDDGAEDSVEELGNTEAEAIYIANRINDMIKCGYTVYDKPSDSYRPVKYSDIAILLRSTHGYAEVYNDILTTAQIPVYCDIGSDYYDTPEIVFLINCLKIIDNPFDDVALLSVMRHPVFGFSDDDFVCIRAAKKQGYFYDSVMAYCRDNDDILSANIKSFLGTLSEFYDKSRYCPTDKLIWDVVEKCDYMSYLSFLPNADLKKANVRALYNKARDFEATDYRGIFNFIRYIDSVKNGKTKIDSAKTLSDDENVVRIMTIHKSKGLEFPIVFVAQCAKNFNLKDASERILIHKGYGMGMDYIHPDLLYRYPLPIKTVIKETIISEMLSEEMRILYVALTRAREKLIITAADKNFDAVISNTVNALKMSKYKIQSSVSTQARNYIRWILAAALRNPSVTDNCTDKFDCCVDDGSKFNLVRESKSQLILNVDDGTKEYDFADLKGRPDGDDLVRNRLDFVYPYEKSALVPSNISVTELKRMENIADDDAVYNYFRQFKVKSPRFVDAAEKPTAADIGTYTHLVMEKLDFSAECDENSVNAQIDSMIERGFITENQASYVNRQNIAKLFSTELGKKMKLNYKSLKREYSFKILIDASDINSDAPKGDKTVVQGMIDVCFEDDNNGIIIVDYKTDKVSGNVDDIARRYKPQLDYYARALEISFGKKVSKKYLFLLDCGQVVEV